MTTRLRLISSADVEPRPRRRNWGPRRLDPAIRVLTISPRSGDTYEVDLDTCRRGERVLDRLRGDTRKPRAREAEGPSAVQVCEKSVIRPTNLQVNVGAKGCHLMPGQVTEAGSDG